MKKIAKDPAHKLLKAYCDILNGSIVYNGSVVIVGTRIPQDADNYIHIYIEDLSPMNTGDSILNNAIVALQVVSLQETTEGDEEVVNNIFEQVIELVGDPEMFIMNGFKCLTSIFSGSEPGNELTDTNYIITRKLQISNIIEQIN